MIKEKPILFSGPLIVPIQEDIKTQTRRLRNLNKINTNPNHWEFGGINRDGLDIFYSTCEDPETCELKCDGTILIKCPYGEVGDGLWVRETFTIESNFNIDSEECYPPPFNDGRPVRRVDDPLYGKHWEQPHYRATDPEPELSYDDMEDPGCRWKPSIHMPRWASRITLGITSIRIERVQDISNSDAKAEGAPVISTSWGHLSEKEVSELQAGTYRCAFANLWNSINGKPRADGIDVSWEANPWVWVVFFERINNG